MIESRAKIEDYKNRSAKVTFNETEHPLWEARLACALIERWGIVAAAPDGEDSAGRAKLRALTADELVERACETAGAAVAAFRAKGWVHISATLAELETLQSADTK